MDIVTRFDERWPVRDEVFPHLPFPILLDYTQQQEVAGKLVQLCQVSDLDMLCLPVGLLT